MVEHTIKIPDWLELLLSSPLLLYRKGRYGYAFRLIPLTRGKFAKVSPRDYPGLIKQKWCVMPGRNTGYAASSITDNGRMKVVLMHRLIAHAPKGSIVDHIDGDGLNNCQPNLRIATNTQNGRNRRPNKEGSSKYKGVMQTAGKKPWRASIYPKGKQINLGYFYSEDKAAEAYDQAAKRHYGEFARLNFPPKRLDWKQFLRRLRNLPPPQKHDGKS